MRLIVICVILSTLCVLCCLCTTLDDKFTTTNSVHHVSKEALMKRKTGFLDNFYTKENERVSKNLVSGKYLSNYILLKSMYF